MTSSYFQLGHFVEIERTKLSELLSEFGGMFYEVEIQEHTYMSNNGSPTKEALNKTVAKNIWGLVHLTSRSPT